MSLLTRGCIDTGDILSALIRPHATQVLISALESETHLCLSGDASQVQALFTWDDLNQLLKMQGCRVRLIRDGQYIPAELYSTQMKMPGGSPITEVIPDIFTEQVRHESLMIIDRLDDMHADLEMLAANVEELLHVPVTATIYGSVGVTSGLGLSSDQTDTMSFQVDGRTYWQVYRPHPHTSSNSSREYISGATPDWEGFLNPGDMLYVPGGWFYVSTTSLGPQLHVRLTYRPVTGADLIQWVQLNGKVDHLVKNLPCSLLSSAQRSRIVGELAAISQHRWAEPDLLSAFWQHQKIVRKPPRTFGLPHSATAALLPASEQFAIRIVPVGQLNICRVDSQGQVELQFNGKGLRFNDAAEPLLRYISDMKVVSMESIVRRFEKDFTVADIRELLAALVRYGIVVVSSSANDNKIADDNSAI